MTLDLRQITANLEGRLRDGPCEAPGMNGKVRASKTHHRKPQNNNSARRVFVSGKL